MKVDQLRSELRERGLGTSGTKPTLVKRLQDALESETAAAPASAPSVEEPEVPTIAPADGGPSEPTAGEAVVAQATANGADANDAAPAAALNGNGTVAAGGDAGAAIPAATALKDVKGASLQKRMAARAARFGGTTEGTLAARAHRFGTLGSVASDDRKEVKKEKENNKEKEKKRPIASDAVATTVDAEELARREKRAKRFAV